MLNSKGASTIRTCEITVELSYVKNHTQKETSVIITKNEVI